MYSTCRKTLAQTICMTLAALIGLTAGAFAQETQMTQMKFEGQPFVLNEFGAIIIGNDGILEIQIMAMESDQRQPAYRKIDLKTGDQIVMVNGKRVKSTADLEEIYNTVKVGEAITIAIKRDQVRQMIAFPKADPEAEEGARIMVRTTLDDGGDGATPILGLGLLVAEEEGEVSVVDILPMPSGLPEDVVFNQGDIIAKLQNEPVASASDLDTRYADIATGDEVVMEITRDGESQSFTFAKPQAPEGRVMMKKQ